MKYETIKPRSKFRVENHTGEWRQGLGSECVVKSEAAEM